MRRSLRALVVGTVVIVAVLPAPLVALLGALGEERASAVERAVASAVRDAREGLQRGDDVRPLTDRVARAHRVRLRVFTAAGAALGDADHDPRVATYGGLTSGGGDGLAGVAGFDRERGDVVAREGFRVALGGSTWTSCAAREAGALWVCEAAAATADGARVVHAQRSSASAAQRLASAPRPLLWLTAFVLASGLALAAWLVARIVGPLDALRAALAARAESARLATRPLALRSPPEIDEVVRAHNAVLAALEGERRARETLAADLVHEIKGPLTAVRLALERLDAGGARSADAVAAVRRIDRTVGELLELSRAEAGLPDDVRAEVPLRTLVANVCETRGERPGITLTVTGDDPRVRVAGEAVGRAVACLVDNALEHARSAVTVRVTATRDGAEVEVGDDGPGVDPAVRPRLFARFVSTRRARGGTGIGLALVRAVAEAHGGTAAESAAPGRGARFTLRLPDGRSPEVHTRFTRD
jgi:signal transduction histidine kinase